MKANRSGEFFAFACAFVCGLGSIPQKVSLGELSAERFNLYFLAIALFFSSLPFFSRRGRAEILDVGPRVLAMFVCLALLFAGAIYSLNVALKEIQPATVAFLSRIEVIFTLILARLILKERLTGIELAGGAIALAGVVILKYRTDEIISKAASFMILSSFLFALAEILVKKNIHVVGTVRFIFWRNCLLVGIFCLVVVARGQDLSLPSPPTFFCVVAASLLLPVIGRLTYVLALRRMDISKVVLVTQSIPLFTALFALAILQSVPTAVEWLGSGLILAGVLVARK